MFSCKSSSVSAVNQNIVLSIEERWENLLDETHEKVRQQRYDEEHAVQKMPPLRDNLYRKIQLLSTEIEWTISNIVCAFTLPTGYNAPGQEDVQYEEAKKKIHLDPKKAVVSSYTLLQLEDVVSGWMFYIKKVLKGLKEKVLNCRQLHNN